MNGEIALAVIGAGRHARALTDHAAPLGRISIRPDWRDAEVRAVLVLGDPDDRTEHIIAALNAGRVVLCPPPLATNAADLARIAMAREQAGGKLIVGGEIAHTEAGARAIELIRSADFGALRSLYVAIRQPRGRSEADVLDVLGWDALDFILAAANRRLRHVHATVATLFDDGANDTAVILMRADDDAVITIEVSRCLPPSLPAPGLGEVEIEALGAHQSVRLEPHATSVRIYRGNGVGVAPWLDAPVIRMLRNLAAVVDGASPDDPLPRQHAAVAAMTAIRASIGAPEAIPVL